MPTISSRHDAYAEEEEEGAPSVPPLTAEEAKAFRERNPSLSPWRVVVWQVAVGVMVALAAFAVSGQQHVGWSAAYGALAVVLPGAIFARGLTGRLSSLHPGTAVFGFFLWEMVKIALSVALLVAAPRWVVPLSWPALLVGLVVTMKVYWVAMVVRPKKLKQTNE
ncbi:MAG TPA: ATP synthase subunit I [Burkholderiaceae bacterium]